jgi:hypothetical protein
MAVALPALAITLLGAVVGGASLVVRFRRARGEERQQLRWVASAAVVAVAGVPVAMAGIAMESAAVVGVAVLGAGPLPGHRRGDPALPAVRPGPDHQPHPGRGRAVPAVAPAGPGRGRPALQPAPPPR